MKTRSLRWLSLAPLVALVGVGCSGDFGSPQRGEGTDHLSQASTVCAKGATVSGIDVSEWQGTVDWNAVKGAGRVFAFARISDGSYHDKDFGANWPAMKAAGLIRGAYQFFEPSQDPSMQADIVVAAVGKLGDGDLPVVADMETAGVSAATIISELHTWADKVTAGTGKKPIIYTGKYWWEGNTGDSGDFSSNWLWHAQYTSAACPDIANAWSDWKFWQYSDADSVAGVSGGVDGDKFNGTLADLQALAGGSGGAEYAAQYVSQTWPLASTAMQMAPGQVVDASIVLKNVGTKNWDTNTKLGTTQPRDRSSPFAGSDWLAPNRPASAGGTVKPGDNATFSFKFHAPTTPGDYKEYFGVVEEGVAWFSDPGQGGPADDVMEAWIQVVPAKWAAQFVSQSFPSADKVLAMKPGDVTDGYIELKNIGTETWKAGVTKLSPTPRDKPSPLGASGWLSATRISSPPADVAPGASYKFPVKLTANQIGDFPQTFGVVEDGVAWFSDPGQGGPADDFLKVHVVVTADGDAGPIGGDAGPIADGGKNDGGKPGNDLTGGGGSGGGCGCHVAGERTPASLFVLSFVGALAAMVRRRRR